MAVTRRRGMTELRVVGSVTCVQDSDGSDLDLRVRVPEGTGLPALGRFAQELDPAARAGRRCQRQRQAPVRTSIECDLVPLSKPQPA